MNKRAIISTKKILLLLLLIAITDKSTASEFYKIQNPPAENSACAEKGYKNDCQTATQLNSQIIQSRQTNPEILDISIKGNADIDNSVVLKVFGLKIGAAFCEIEAEAGLENLKKLSAVKNAFLKKEYNDKRNGVHLKLILQKSRTLNIYPVASRSLSDKLSMGIKLSDSNFRRRNEKLKFSILLRGVTILSALWDKPFLPGIPVLGLKYALKYQDYKYPYPQFEGYFLNDRVKRLESAASVRFNINDLFSIIISPGIDQMFGEGPVLKKNSSQTIFSESYEGLFSTLEISMRARRLNDSVYPTSGFSLELSHKNWGVFEKNSHLKTGHYYFTGSFFFRVKRPILLIHTRSVISSSGSPLILMEHLGGETSIRGYEYGVFTGENSFLSRYEIRLPLNFTNNSDIEDTLIPLDFNIFFDTGMCWDNGDILSGDRLHSGFGCSMNIISPERAVLRIGCMWNRKSTGNFYLDVGMDF